MSNITLQKIHKHDKEILRNLFNLWHHDLSVMDCSLFPDVDSKGFYDYAAVEEYFENEIQDKLFAYFVRYNGALAGFCIISKPPYVKVGCDYCIQEFFITGNYREKGIGSETCKIVFSKHPGRYCLHTIDRNIKAKSFWLKLINLIGTDILIENDGKDFIFSV